MSITKGSLLIKASTLVSAIFDAFIWYINCFPANVTDENREKALEMLRDYSNVQFATAPRRLALHVATGQEFQDLIKPYLTNGLTKGIPSLFADLKPLYKDSVKRQIIEDIVEELRATFATSTGDSVQPTTYLWALYLLAQHHSYLGRHKQALEILDIAIVHTPTLPELYMTRARALKRAGDPHGAARAMNDARLLDGQDRFINTKTGKYLLRAGMVNEADAIFSKFTRVSVSQVMEISSCRSSISGPREGRLQGQIWRRCRQCITLSSRAIHIDELANSTLL